MDYNKLLVTEPKYNVSEFEETCLAFDINQDEHNSYQKLHSNSDKVSELK